AAPDFGHHLGPERDEAGRARAVARLRERHAVAYARGDALVLALDAGRQVGEQAVALAPAGLDLFGARSRLLVEGLQTLLALRAQARELRVAFGQSLLGRLGRLHLFEYLRLKLRHLLLRGVRLAYGGFVRLRVRRGPQV